MTQLLRAQDIIGFHDQSIVTWKQSGTRNTQEHLLQLVEENHAFNYQLWHAEDRARRDDQGFEFIYHAKREIDQCNQQRNNRMELMDEWFYHHLQPAPLDVCPVNSETPGMMIDRLSILALKKYHMALQTHRMEVTPEHRQQCEAKLATITAQQRQLGQCLDELIDQVQQKTRTFRVYHQFKMYNDPSLNPELYGQGRHWT